MIAPTSGSASLNKIPSPLATSRISVSRRFSNGRRRRSSPRRKRSNATSVAWAPPRLVRERDEVAPSVVPQHDRLAVDQRHIAGEGANRLGDCWEPIGEVRAAAAPDVHQLKLLENKDAETVVLDLVQPAWSGGRALGERWLARADEADRGISPPEGRGVAPDYGFQTWTASKAAVMAMRIIGGQGM